MSQFDLPVREVVAEHPSNPTKAVYEKMGSAVNDIPEVDVLLVGAGFASFTLMNKLRKLNLSIKIFEKGAASGGIWYWNCYPGARVDSDTPVIYMLYEPELNEDFTFTERYAGGKELQRYFKHIEKKWDLAKDITYNKHVDAAVFDEKKSMWLVECADGSEIYCRYFIPCIGFASKHFNPPFKGLSDFKGDVLHTAKWPQHDVNLKNKRVAHVGTGASGIQSIQEIAPKSHHYTIYQRTPNMCLPMNQRKLDPKEEEEKKKSGWYEEQQKKTYHTFAGFPYDFEQKKTLEASPEERERFFHKLMVEDGGFKYWLANYEDIFFDQKANDEVYEFWKKTVRQRIPDPKKAELLAPDVPPHPWGTKRPSLEQNFYEVVSMDHVDLIDVNADPIIEVTEKGIRTRDGGVVEVDTIILATGFDSVTGSLAQLNIQGTNGGTIADHWKNGTTTAMGVALNEFPNSSLHYLCTNQEVVDFKLAYELLSDLYDLLKAKFSCTMPTRCAPLTRTVFFVYGPQAPTAFSNGPSCTQIQAEWIDKTIQSLEKDRITRFEAKKETEDEWVRRLHEKWNASLFPLAKSWYQGANIPGRRVEPLNWSGGIPEYIRTLDNSTLNNYQGWNVVKASA